MADSLVDVLQRMLHPSYSIERELVGGGMSRLFLAREQRLNRTVVVKVLPPDLVSEASTARFRREIRVMVDLQHPHILPVLTAGGEGGILFYVMPYVAGESLHDRIAREGQLPVADARRILGQIADALAFAHARGVVHRDVKPGNILLLDGHAIVADFGIARALDGDADTLTGAEARVGTPAYMAPEGSRDHRADLYALAVVAHEMLTGVRPTGPTSAEALAARTAGARRKPSAEERTIAAVVARGLAHRPEDRFQSSAEMRAALVVPHPLTPPAPPAARARPRVGRRVAVIALLTLVAASAGVVHLSRAWASNRAESALRSDLFVVLPFGATGGSEASQPQGDLVAQQIVEALVEWRGITTVEPARVSEALAEEADGPLRPTRARELARRLGAGRLVWGDYSTIGDTVRVQASLYDLTHSGWNVRTRHVEYHGAPVGASAIDAYRRLVAGLLRDDDRLPWRDASDRRPASLEAWATYDTGAAALRGWDLPGAAHAFRRALALDPEHAPAQIALARILAYDDSDTTRLLLRTAARHAVSLRTLLTERESELAVGLLALAEARYPDACATFRRVVERYPEEFDGWYGLGECQRRDSVVIRSPRSASGFAFRGSYRAAAAAYERALASLRGPHPAFPYLQLQRVLFTETNRQRTGYRDGAARPLRAYPSLADDTLAFVPYEVRPGVVTPVPATRLPAIEDNIHRLRQSFAMWTRMTPASVDAHRALSEVLEAMGHISEGGADDVTALSAIRRARALARDTILPLVAIHVRQMLKDGDFPGARALADSALASQPDPTPQSAVTLAGLAALTGRVDQTARLLRELSAAPRFLPPVVVRGSSQVLSPELRRARADLLAHAALGACGHRIRELPTRIAQLVEAHAITAADRRVVHDAVLERPLSLAVPCLGPAAVLPIALPNDRLTKLQQAAARRDVRAFAVHLDSLAVTRRFNRVADVTPDYAFGEAWLLAAQGDTVAALSRLDQSLDALPLMSPSSVLQVPIAAGLVRSMALAAALSARSGDDRSADRWASAVVTLWSGADVALQPLVTEMRKLTRSSAISARPD